MSFSECILSATQQGAISRDEADDLMRRYEAHRSAAKGTDHPGGEEGAAKDALAAQLTGERLRKERLAKLASDRTEEIVAHAETFRTVDGAVDVIEAFKGVLDNSGNVLAGVQSVTGLRNALIGYAHGRLEELLFETRRTFGLGKRMGKALLDDMVDEGFGKGTGNVAAKKFVEAWRVVADELVDRFNAAGGDIAKLTDYFPQNHDARRLAAAGQEAWTQFIKPLLDPAKMRDPLTGGPLSPERLDEALAKIYRRIVTDGAIDMEPSGQVTGRGALANQRSDHRFLIFKDGAAWRDYNAAFGGGSVYDALMGHLRGLAKDVAAMEVLGPNPNATVEWMRQTARQEAAKFALGEDSLWNGKSAWARTRETLGLGQSETAIARSKTGRLDAGDEEITRLWNTINGSNPTGSMVMADAFGALKNFLTAAQLAGTAVTAVLGDPFQQANARRFAGLPQLRWISEIIPQMFNGASKREITRAGVIMSDALEHLATDFRGLSATAASRELSQWLPDRVFQWSGLMPWTNANRRSQAFSFMFEAGDRVGQSLAEIAADGPQGARYARFLEGFGVTSAEWDMIRAARPLDHGEAGGLLRVMDVIAAHPGDDAAFAAAMKYSAAVHGYMEEAVPQGTARTRAGMAALGAAGTLPGELGRGMGMYMSYPAAVMMSLLRGVGHEMSDFGTARGLAFAAGSLVTLTIGGALVMQVAELRKGRDPRDIADPEFWALALAKGGGLGFFGDFLLADYKRGTGDALIKLPGPIPGFVADAWSVVNPRAALGGEEVNRAKTATKFGANYTPFQNMWWLKPVSQRLIWDRLQLLADPEAERTWRQNERKLLRENGQGVWWGPGESLPRRMPNWGTAIQ